MALGAGNVLLLVGSLLAATAALFWPNIEQAYLAYHHSQRGPSNSANVAAGKCPLGYEGPMPTKHPPVPGSSNKLKQEPSAAAAAAALHQKPTLVTFANANIWTANVKAPWAVSMTVNLATGDIVGMKYADGTSSSSSSSSPGTTSSSSSSSSSLGGSSSSSPGSSSSSSSSSGLHEKGEVGIDMKGAFVMPGFVDPHVHLIPGGLLLQAVNLRNLTGGEQEMAARILESTATATATPAANAAASDAADSAGGSNGGGSGGGSISDRRAWIIGSGWSESDWGGQLPDRSWVDEVCGGRPAFLARMDSHMALVNTAALKAAGLLPNNNSPTTTAGTPESTTEREQPTAPAIDSGSGDAAAVAAAVAAADAQELIDRDPKTGLPTGILRESAMNLVERLIPPPSVEDRADALQAAGRYLLSRGVTSVGDMGWGLFGSGNLTWEDLEQVYDPAATGNSAIMPVRVSAYVPLRTWQRLANRVEVLGTFHHPQATAAAGAAAATTGAGAAAKAAAKLTWGGCKEFADGSLGSSTALMWEPYLDAAPSGASRACAGSADGAQSCGVDSSRRSGSSNSPSNGGDSGSLDRCHGHSCGTRIVEPAELGRLIKGAAGAGLQVAVHAIGDRAVDDVLGVFESVLGSAGDGSSNTAAQQAEHQHRIEHVQHISSAATAAKMASLGLSGVPNPQHLLTDRYMLVSKLGVERAGPERAFAYKTLSDAGVSLGFGSDWPVVEVEPWSSVFAAVHRKQPGEHTGASDSGGGGDRAAGSLSDDTAPSGAPVWESERERLGLSEVLMGHTFNAARVARLDHWVGQLAPGYKADFLVLDRSPFGAAGGGGDRSDTSEEWASASFDGSYQLPHVVRTYMDGACVFGCDGDAAASMIV